MAGQITSYGFPDRLSRLYADTDAITLLARWDASTSSKSVSYHFIPTTVYEYQLLYFYHYDTTFESGVISDYIELTSINTTKSYTITGYTEDVYCTTSGNKYQFHLNLEFGALDSNMGNVDQSKDRIRCKCITLSLKNDSYLKRISGKANWLTVILTIRPLSNHSGLASTPS